MTRCQFIQCTASSPGAIGIIQLIGDTQAALTALTGHHNWPIGRMRWSSFSDIDDGLAGRIGEDIAQIMPHGGPRVMQRLATWLREHSVAPVESDDVDARVVYPEAQDACEALAMSALARAESPLTIELLLNQPQRWRETSHVTNEDVQRSTRLNRLIIPPMVVLAGPANVGKSTLSNALLGRSMSITLDRPGTTRDYTTGRIDLAGLVVDWHDTPGLRETDDEIEKRSIELARHVMNEADYLIAMTDAESDWPALPRKADLHIANKCDVRERADANLNVSAETGHNLDQLVQTVRETLVPQTDLEHPGPWVFDQRLLSMYRNS